MLNAFCLAISSPEPVFFLVSTKNAGRYFMYEDVHIILVMTKRKANS